MESSLPSSSIIGNFDLIKKALAPEPNLVRFRQGKVIAYAGSDTIDVQIGGAVDEDNNVVITEGIKLFGNFTPTVGQAIWLVTDGLDIFAIGQLYPYGASGGGAIINLDGGHPDSIYGGLSSFDAGGV